MRSAACGGSIPANAMRETVGARPSRGRGLIGRIPSSAQRRRVRLREAPDDPLERGGAVISGNSGASAEEALEIAEEIPVDSGTDELTLFP